MSVIFESSQRVADTIMTFSFRSERPLDYIAGQFIELTIPHQADERGDRRWFTLSSSPTEELAAITTRISPENGSSFKRALLALKPGDPVMISAPMGDFVLPKDPGVPVVFVAGGIGVTPIRSMVKWLLDKQQPRPLQLLYGANRIEEVAFRQLFGDYSLPTDIILSQPPKGWDGITGRLSAKTILELAPDADTKLYYLSGPEPFVEELVLGLAEAGVARSRLATDFFLNYASV